MSEDMTPEVEPKEPQPTARLVIELWPDNEVKVSGPVNDAILSYGLLAVARDLIMGQQIQKNQPKRHGGLMNHLRRFR